MIARVWFVPKCTLFVPFCSNRQNRHFGPSEKAPPKLFLAGRAPAGQAFAGGFANSERRILGKLDTVYTDLCPVMYRSIVFKKSKLRLPGGCAPLNKVMWREPTLHSLVLAKSERSDVGLNAYATLNSFNVRNGRSRTLFLVS